MAMPIPNRQTYLGAMLRAEQALHVDVRRNGKLYVMASGPWRGQPFRSNGRFATVFRLDCPDGTAHALRCFVIDQPDARKRYELLSDYLARHPVRAFVECQYFDDGVMVDSGGGEQWWPVVKMGWVEGDHLSSVIENAIETKDFERLQAIEAGWVELVDCLEESGIAHGDLHPENVMVTRQGEIVLVDYDGVWVPGCEGLGCEQIGMENYQHPRRAAQHYGPAIDRFSELVILLALRVFRVAPQLYDTLYKGADQLLLSVDDYRSPGVSKTLGVLRGLEHPEVEDLLKRLDAALTGAPDQIDPLGLSPERRVVEAFERAYHRNDKAAMLAIWLDGGSDLPELERYAQLMVRYQHRTKPQPGADLLAQFLRAVGSHNAVAAVGLWPAVSDQPSAQQHAEVVRRWQAQMNNRSKPSSADAVADFIRCVTDVYSAAHHRALLLWPSVRHQPAAQAYAARVAQLEQRYKTTS